MIHAILFLVAQALGGATACDIDSNWSSIRKEPLSRQLILELATDRTEYAVGQAVEFRLTLRNIGERRVEGLVTNVTAPSRAIRIDYQRDREPKRTLDRATIDLHGLIAARGSIEPEAAVEGRNLRAIDGGRDAFMLDAAGVYRFIATFCNVGGDLNEVVVSTSVTVDVRPVSAGEQRAWEAYSTGLAAYAERFSYPRQSAPEPREEAYEFVEHFPDSPWAATLRRRLLAWGPSPAFDDAQRERYERLRQAARQRGEKRIDGQEP